jgi:hypothetical protein
MTAMWYRMAVRLKFAISRTLKIASEVHMKRYQQAPTLWSGTSTATTFRRGGWEELDDRESSTWGVSKVTQGN